MKLLNSQAHSNHWPRAIILVDMNAFFASIEQKDFPMLRGRPVAVTNGLQGTGIITCSYEARSFGIKTGMRLPQAKQLCPDLIQRPARPKRYAEISTNIMQSLTNITPEVEVFSVDEAFLDITHCQLLASPIELARQTQQLIFEVSGLNCSIGLSGDKTTAKFAAKQNKPAGFTVIPPWEAAAILAPQPVDALCGINHGIKNFLARYHAHTCGDVAKMPVSILGKRFGAIGRRIWLMCQGKDPAVVQQSIAPPKSMGHGKVMPPNTVDKNIVLTYLQHMCEKLSSRLRQHEMEAQHFSVGVKNRDWGWLGDKFQLAYSSNQSRVIFAAAKQCLLEHWQQQPLYQIHVHALDPKPSTQQLDLFTRPDPKQSAKDQVTDAINERFGEFTLAPARLINRSQMPNVIAPAWRPTGHRQIIPN